MDAGIVPTKASHIECVSGQNVVEMEIYILSAQSGRGEPMRLITEKNKNEIGKRLSAIYYITVHGFGKGQKTDLEAMEKIIEHVHDIALAVGGERFSNIDIPAYVKRIGEMAERKTDDCI